MQKGYYYYFRLDKHFLVAFIGINFLHISVMVSRFDSRKDQSHVLQFGRFLAFFPCQQTRKFVKNELPIPFGLQVSNLAYVCSLTQNFGCQKAAIAHQRSLSTSKPLIDIRSPQTTLVKGKNYVHKLYTCVKVVIYIYIILHQLFIH